MVKGKCEITKQIHCIDFSGIKGSKNPDIVLSIKSRGDKLTHLVVNEYLLRFI